jgi:hypothetical protein
MDWAAIGAVSEVIGATAVVISLIYLATQIRQATKFARASTRNAIAESTQGLTQDLIEDQGMAEIFVKHFSGQKLNPVETLRLHGRCYRDLRHWENIYYQVRAGLLSDDEWSGFRKNLAALFGIEIYREYWKDEEYLYSDAFRHEVDSILRDSGELESRVEIAERFRDTYSTGSS